jgi:hypothetical protein
MSDMKHLSRGALLTFAVATVAGACLHFVYDLAPNAVTAVFSPVNESLWEHLKIIFWPLLVAALVRTSGTEQEGRGPWAVGILGAAAGTLLLGYGYHILLGGEAMAVDLCIYVLMMAMAFLLAGGMNHPAICARADALSLLVLALGCAIILFTFLPPDNVLFADLTRANTWSTIPF